jgi:hypothetical protein
MRAVVARRPEDHQQGRRPNRVEGGASAAR